MTLNLNTGIINTERKKKKDNTKDIILSAKSITTLNPRNLVLLYTLHLDPSWQNILPGIISSYFIQLTKRISPTSTYSTNGRLYAGQTSTTNYQRRHHSPLVACRGNHLRKFSQTGRWELATRQEDLYQNNRRLR